MKNALIITLLLTLILFTPNGFAQDYMKWELPEHAILRLGKGSINDIKYSPNGDLIAVATSIGVWIYDADSGKEIRLLQKHTDSVAVHAGSVHSLAFSPNGKLLAGSALDGIHLWEPNSGLHLSTLKEPLKKSIDILSVSVKFFSDGRTLASTRGGIIRLWDVANRTISKTLTGHTGTISSITVSPNGKTIVSGSYFESKKALRWWDIETGRTMFISTNVAGDVWTVAFSPDGKILACVDSTVDSNKIHIFDGSSGEILRTLDEQKDTAVDLTFSPDSKMLTRSGSDNTIHLWDPHSGQRIHTFRGHTSYVVDTSFSPDGKTLVSGSGDGTIRFWDLSTKQQRFSISGHWSYINALAFSADSKTLISGITGKTVHKWDIETGQLTSILTGHYDGSISAFDIGRDLFACITRDEEFNQKFDIRHIDTGEFRTSRSTDGLLLNHYLNFSYVSGIFIYTGWDRNGRAKVEYWNTLYNRLDFEFVPPNGVAGLAVSSDSKLLAIATEEEVSLWKFGTNELIRLYPIESNFVLSGYIVDYVLAFSNDSKTLAIGDRWAIRLIELDTGNLITTLSIQNFQVEALAFSPNGKILASGSKEGTILIWDLDKIEKNR